MQSPVFTKIRLRLCLRTVLCVTAFRLMLTGGFCPAGDIRLKNDLIIEGRPVLMQAISTSVPPNAGETIVHPVTMVEAGMRRVYVPTANIIQKNDEAELATLDVFKLPQRRSQTSRALGSVGLALETTEFDERGVRTVTLGTDRGPLKIEQGITDIGPKFISVAALSYGWEFGLSTTSIPAEHLDRMIRRVTDPQKPEDRFTIVRFYLQAGLYLRALNELDAMARDFPDLKDRVDQFLQQARQLLAQQLLDELTQRRQRGQHRLAYARAREFPVEDMSAAILRQVRQFMEQYEQAEDDRLTVLALLGELQAELRESPHWKLLEAMRNEVGEQLDPETLPGLKPFLQQADDDNQTAAEKLSLAYSGWLLGAEAADERLERTIGLWKARFLIMEYLRSTDDASRQQLLADLLAIEGIGPDTVLALVPRLPPVLHTSGLEPGQPLLITVDNAAAGVPADSPEVRYQVLLPTEYSPHHRYPMVVALHSVERNMDWELRWWGGTTDDPLQAQRRGYIVIVPDYEEPDQKMYSYSPMSHYRVQMAVRDARKRFRADSDRIFLSGHGSGGDAAFDIGFAHPDLFAGVIPVTARIAPEENPFRKLWRNGKAVPWYVVGGQLDRDTFERNAPVLNNMMIGRYDIILTEYVGRGYESYYSEIHHLFDWMDRQTRRPDPASMTMLTLRPNDNRFYWLKANTLSAEPSRTTRPRTPPAPAAPAAFNILSNTPKIIRGEILTGAEDRNVVTINSPSKSHTIWLNSALIDFNKRLKVTVGGHQKFNDFVDRSVEAILEDLRTRGDRERIYEARLDVE